MLKTLNIENIAVIEKANIDFSLGLNVLTGETGAGKSIVVDSINAILGERTSKEIVRHGAEFASVSAVFEDVDQDISDEIRDFGYAIDEDNTILLSRRISQNGKTACRVNGAPATVSMLKEIGARLVNIHGQHDSQALLNADFHYKFIDMLAEDKTVFDAYQKDFKAFMSVRKRLKTLTAHEDTKDRKMELLEYQIDELENADIRIGERDELTARKTTLSNIETIRTALSESLMTFNGDETFSGVTTLLSDTYAKISLLGSFSVIAERIEALNDEAQIIKESLSDTLETLDTTPGEIEEIEARLDFLYRLSLKYGTTEEEMLQKLQNAKEERNAILFSDEELSVLNGQYDELLNNAITSAGRLSDYRKTTARWFEKAVCEELYFLNMENIRFLVDFEKDKLSSVGYDKIEFLISTNPGEPPKPLSKIASGGELSRIMLAIKNIIAHNDTVNTLIFDEIDTGISGRASRKIGLKLKSVSKNTQVICVTHSAQIASVADTHFLIEKAFQNNKTYTKVTPLDFEGRKHELARIMGGLEITQTLLSSAQELLSGEEI